MQCPKPKNNKYTDFFIYQIVVASSRGFDWPVYYDWITYNDSTSVGLENICLFSKTPELDNKGNDYITIINTRIHLPRYNYEELIKTKNIKSLNLDNDNYNN